jgi:hypothetical protein
MFSEFLKNNLFQFSKFNEKSEIIKNCIIGVGLISFSIYFITTHNQNKIINQNNDLLDKFKKQQDKLDYLIQKNNNINTLLVINNSILLNIKNYLINHKTIYVSRSTNTLTIQDNIDIDIDRKENQTNNIEENLTDKIINETINEIINDNCNQIIKENTDKETLIYEIINDIINEINNYNCNQNTNNEYNEYNEYNEDNELLDECYDSIPLNNVKKFTGIQNLIWFK